VVLAVGATTAFALQPQGDPARGLDMSVGPFAGTAYASAAPGDLAADRPLHGAHHAAYGSAAKSLPTLPRQQPLVPSIAIGSYQQVLVNRDRSAARLRALSWSSCLYSVAVANARRMASQGFISHTNGAWLDYACHLGVQGGENVGWWSGGINDAQINSMFMASTDHRANIMGPYHFVATAWAVAPNGFAYIAVEFA
jgi:uncharacterized protein YkwD